MAPLIEASTHGVAWCASACQHSVGSWLVQRWSGRHRWRAMYRRGQGLGLARLPWLSALPTVGEWSRVSRAFEELQPIPPGHWVTRLPPASASSPVKLTPSKENAKFARDWRIVVGIIPLAPGGESLAGARRGQAARTREDTNRMAPIADPCPRCGRRALVRNGHAPSGKQKFWCRACHRHSREQPSPNSYSAEQRADILRAYAAGTSLRGLSRTFGVSRNAVSRWLKRAAIPPAERELRGITGE
jgi:transposase-like protein